MIRQKDFLSQAKEAIENNFPQFKVKAVSLAGEGMDSRAFVVNKDFIFRFPKHEEVVVRLKAEICLLPKLQPRVKFAIPNFEYVGQENGFPFAGYKKIHGIGLEKELLKNLDSDLKNRLLKEIADFLRQIHSFPVSLAEECGVKIADFKKNYADDLAAARRDAYRLLDKKTSDYIEKLYAGYLSDAENFDYLPAFLHADFSPGHIIYDPGRQAVAGVIDFGDLEIGDPDYDLMYLYEDYWGEDFIREFLKYYPHGNPERLLKKLDFFSRCNTVQDVLIGLRRKDDEILRYALEKLKKETKNI